MRYVPPGAELARLAHVRIGPPPPGSPRPALVLGNEPDVSLPPAWRADTATGIVLRLLRDMAGRAALRGLEAATAAEFTGDRLLALWALSEPDAALARAEALDDAARAVEFGVCRSDEATQIACFVRAYPEETGLTDPVLLYSALLPQVRRLLDAPREFDLYWIGEYSDVLRANHMLHSGAVQIDDYPDLDLTVLQTPLRLHDLTRLTAVSGFRLLTVRSENTYVFEYRRESWVHYQSRRPLARVDLRPLAARLGLFERAPGVWRADPLTAPVCRLYLDDGGRPAPSRIDAETVIAEVLDFFRTAGRSA